jgi:hypothetical protein
LELTASHGAGVRVSQKAEKKEAPAAGAGSGRKAIAAPSPASAASAENGESEESGGSGVHALPSAGVVVEAEDETGTHLFAPCSFVLCQISQIDLCCGVQWI